MSDSDEFKNHLLDQLEETHRRFADLMEARLEEAEASEVERYFGLLSNLVAKLEDERKTLKDVAREMVAESAAMIMADLAK
jgi:hypothetical protein